MTKKCRVCEDELTDENWYASLRKCGSYICKACNTKRARLWKNENSDKVKAQNARWREKNPEKSRAAIMRGNRKNGALPMSENKDSSAYLGVYVAERLIRHYFNHVTVMPYGNPGFDFICNKDKLIDVKSSCLTKDGRWKFNINYNEIADYFLCIGFDNLEDLNPLYVWMIPGYVVNHLKSVSISPKTIYKWDEYKIDIDGMVSCCDTMKNGDE